MAPPEGRPPERLPQGTRSGGGGRRHPPMRPPSQGAQRSRPGGGGGPCETCVPPAPQGRIGWRSRAPPNVRCSAGDGQSEPPSGRDRSSASIPRPSNSGKPPSRPRWGYRRHAAAGWHVRHAHALEHASMLFGYLPEPFLLRNGNVKRPPWVKRQGGAGPWPCQQAEMWRDRGPGKPGGVPASDRREKAGVAPWASGPEGWCDGRWETACCDEPGGSG